MDRAQRGATKDQRLAAVDVGGAAHDSTLATEIGIW
jgi:hypothetical protein